MSTGDKSKPEFQNKPVERVVTVAHCSVRVDVPSASSILNAALSPDVVRLATRKITRTDHNSSTIQPADLGDHDPIPQDCVVAEVLETEGEEK